MRTAKFSELISQSVRRTKWILFQPFSLKKWLALVLIAALAGGLGSGGSGGSGSRNNRDEKGKAKTEAASQTGQSSPETKSKAQSPSSSSAPAKRNPAGLGALAIFLLALFSISIVIFSMWLTARFHFIWVHAISNNSGEIRRPFAQYRLQGNSLFRTTLFIMIGAILYIGVLAVIGVLFLKARGAFEPGYVWDAVTAFKVLLPLLLILVPSVLVLGFFGMLISAFVVPVMFRDQMDFRPAWKKVWALFKNNVGDFILFAFVNLLLGIVTGILGMILLFVAVLVIIIAGIVILGPIYFITMVLLKSKVLMAILGVLVGIPFFVSALTFLLGVRLPFGMFHRTLSLYYLGSHGPEYSVIRD